MVDPINKKQLDQDVGNDIAITLDKSGNITKTVVNSYSENERGYRIVLSDTYTTKDEGKTYTKNSIRSTFTAPGAPPVIENTAPVTIDEKHFIKDIVQPYTAKGNTMLSAIVITDDVGPTRYSDIPLPSWQGASKPLNEGRKIAKELVNEKLQALEKPKGDIGVTLDDKGNVQGFTLTTYNEKSEATISNFARKDNGKFSVIESPAKGGTHVRDDIDGLSILKSLTKETINKIEIDSKPYEGKTLDDGFKAMKKAVEKTEATILLITTGAMGIGSTSVDVEKSGQLKAPSKYLADIKNLKTELV
jgi:uncharacterized protein YuzE